MKGHLKFMSKNKPKTIADLNINWTFDFQQSDREFDDAKSEFRKLNDDIHDLLIVKKKYKFFVSYSNTSFQVDYFIGDQLTDLIVELDYKIYCLQLDEKVSKLLVLDRFELIGKNTFRIHFKE